MQDGYAGDIGDYGKFIFLRRLREKGLSIGVNWYVPWFCDDKKGNGRFVEIPEKYAKYDPELAEKLREVSALGRTVKRLEQMGLVDGAAYWSDPITRDRPGWHAAALEKLPGAEVVFLDPDNGLLPGSVKPGTKRSAKYVYPGEMADYLLRGQSVILYSSRRRKKEEEYFNELLLTIAAACEAAGTDPVFFGAITFNRYSVRDLIAVSTDPERAAKIGEVIRDLMLRGGICYRPDMNNMIHLNGRNEK